MTPLEIARVVRSAREGQGLSVEALAHESNLSAQRLRAIETDGAQLRLSELDAIAQGLGLDPEALADGGLAHNYVTRLPSAGRSALRSPSG